MTPCAKRLFHLASYLAGIDPFLPGLWAVMQELRLVDYLAYDYLSEYIATGIIGG